MQTLSSPSKTYSLQQAAEVLELSEASILRLGKSFNLIPDNLVRARGISVKKIRFTVRQLKFLSVVRQRILKGQSLHSIQKEVLSRVKELKKRQRDAEDAMSPVEDASVIYLNKVNASPLPRTGGYDAMVSLARTSVAAVEMPVVQSTSDVPVIRQAKARFEQYKEEQIAEEPVFRKLAKIVCDPASLAAYPAIKAGSASVALLPAAGAIDDAEDRPLTFLFPDKPVSVTNSLFIPSPVYTEPARPDWLPSTEFLQSIKNNVLGQ